MLAIVLILQHRLHLRKPLGKALARGRTFIGSAIGVPPPIEVNLGKVVAALPQTAIDRALHASAVGTGFGTEYPPAGLTRRLVFIQAFCDEALPFFTDPGRQRVHVVGLVKRRDGLHRSVEQLDKVGESIAEETGDPQCHVHSRAVEQADRQNLEVIDPLTARRPHRTHAHQRHGLGDVVTAGTHGRRAPYRQAQLAQVIAMVLEVSFQQQIGGLEADSPGRGGRQVAHVHGKKVAASGQHIQAPTARRAAGACRHETTTQRVKHALHFAGAAGIQTRRDDVTQAVENLGQIIVRRQVGQRFALRDAFDKAGGVKLQPLARIAGTAPGIAAQGLQCSGPRAGPGFGQLAVKRIEVQLESLAQRAQQTGLRAMPVTARNAQQGQQGVDAQATLRRLTEDMQAIANLRFLQVTQVSVQTWQPERRVGIAVEVLAQRQFAVDMGFTDQFENVTLQLARAARIEHLRFIEFVGEQLQIAQRAVGLRAGQRRHQVIDDDRLSAPLGLCALARIVDDERIDVRHGAQHRVRPAGSRQPHALAGQPLEVAVLADMHHRMRAVGFAQPEVERQIAMGGNQIRVVIHRARVDLITPRRLNADEREAKAQSGDHHPAAAKHRIGVRRAPTGVHRIAIFLRQFVESRQVLLQRHALVTRALVDTVQIIGHAAQQLLDQFGASVRQRRQRITLGLHGAQDIQRRSRRIEPHTIADPPVASRVVGENQRHTLFAIGQARKLDPAPRQLRDEIHPVRLGAVADHVRLTALTAPGQVLEADRPADDASVQLRQGNVHRQISSAKALFAGLPGRLVVLRADGLNDRYVAPERTQMRRLRT